MVGGWRVVLFESKARPSLGWVGLCNFIVLFLGIFKSGMNSTGNDTLTSSVDKLHPVTEISYGMLLFRKRELLRLIEFNISYSRMDDWTGRCL